jgi:general secretion pathway protein A
MPTVESTDKTTGQAALLGFFGLQEQPYGVTPDPRFLYMTASHREALASLVYAIETKRGFSALVAEPGMGKTTLLFHVLDRIKSSARTAFLFRPTETREISCRASCWTLVLKLVQPTYLKCTKC